MTELDKMLLPLVGTLLIGTLTWFLNTLLKLRQEFDTHREGKGHKLLVDAFFELETDFNEKLTEAEKVFTEKLTKAEKNASDKIAQLDKRVEVNLTKISNIQDGLKDLSGTTKYNLRSIEDRLSLVEKILESNGYLIFGSLKKPRQPIDKDTFAKVEEIGNTDQD